MLLPIIGLTVTAGHLGVSLWARKRHIAMQWYDWVVVSVVLVALPVSIISAIGFFTAYYPFYGMASLLIFHVMSVTLPLIVGIWYFLERFVHSHGEEGDSGSLELLS